MRPEQEAHLGRILNGIPPAWVVVACSLLGCPDSGAPDRRATVLSVMLPPGERPFWESVARGFEAAHPAVRVNLVEGPESTDLRENLYTASLLARDPAYDLVYMDVIWTSKFAAAGWLVPLDDFFGEDERARFLPGTLEAGRFNGRLYRIPVRTDMGLLYYRRDLLDRAGLPPPESFEDLSRTGRALQDPPGLWGFAWQGKQYEGLVCGFLEVLHGHGGYWVDPSTLEIGLDRPEAFQALEFLVACRNSGPISPPGVTTYQEEESRRLFQDGRAVFLRNWPYVWQLAQGRDSAVRGLIGVRPMVANRQGRPSGTLGGWGLGVSAYSRHPDIAVEFVRFAVGIESQRGICAASGYAPAVREAYRDSALLVSNPFLKEIERLHAHAIPRPAIPRYAQASDILQRRLSAALTGQLSSEAALRAAARETRLLLAPDRAGRIAGP